MAVAEKRRPEVSVRQELRPGNVWQHEDQNIYLNPAFYPAVIFDRRAGINEISPTMKGLIHFIELEYLNEGEGIWQLAGVITTDIPSPIPAYSSFALIFEKEEKTEATTKYPQIDKFIKRYQKAKHSHGKGETQILDEPITSKLVSYGTNLYVNQAFAGFMEVQREESKRKPTLRNPFNTVEESVSYFQSGVGYIIVDTQPIDQAIEMNKWEIKDQASNFRDHVSTLVRERNFLREHQSDNPTPLFIPPDNS